MRRIMSVAFLIAAINCLSAYDWPQFRGPTGQGVSSTALPTEWGDSKNLKWKTPLPGPGSSTPIVLKDRIYVTCYTGYAMKKQGDIGKIDELKRHLLCINGADGKIIWTATVDGNQPEDPYQGFIRDHGYASSTPVTDGENIYVFFGKRGVFAFNLEGKQLWKTSVGTMSSKIRWGSAASLVMYKDLVIVNAAEESRSIQALDKKTGSVVWKAEEPKFELCYSTPLLVNSAGKDELIVSLPGHLWSLDPASGKTHWKIDSDIKGNVSPSVIEHDGVIYANGGYPNILASAVSLKSDKHEVLWKSSKTSSYVASPVMHEGHLYVASHNGLARCINPKTGESVYDQRLPVKGDARGGSVVYASPLLADGKLYVVTRFGGAFVLKAEPKYQLLASNKFSEDDSDFNASPAVMGKNLLLRSNLYLYCIGE